jgi:serine/threonine protein kinase
LIDEPTRQIKLIDFGASTPLSRSRTPVAVFTGTKIYAAPEIWRGEPYMREQAEVYTLGVVLFQLFYKGPPNSDDIRSLIVEKAEGMMGRTISEGSAELLMKLMHVDPSQRPTIPEIKEFSFFKEDLDVLHLVPSDQCELCTVT